MNHDLNEATKQYDPRMHTAEHILNQTMVRMFNCGRAFSAHIEKKKSKCDYRLQRDLTDEEVATIEQTVNAIIRTDLPVTEDIISRSDAQIRFNLEKLPEEAGESIRIIRVGDYDACPCIGVHISHTSEIGTFKIISREFSENRLRIRFKVFDSDQK